MRFSTSFLALALLAASTASQGVGPLFVPQPDDAIDDIAAMDARAILCADVNGDTFEDIFVANVGQDVLYINQGDDSFVAVNIGPAVGVTFDAAFQDVDGDGDPDLYVARGDDTSNFLFINQGGLQAGQPGAFAPIGPGGLTDASVILDANDSFGVAWADLDGAGGPDLVVVNNKQQHARYFSDGAGDFTSSNTSANTARSRDVTLADLDNDGDIDYFVANSNGENNAVFVNDGAGNFSPLVSADPIVNDGADSYAGSAEDFDGDGLVDLFVANRAGENNTLYENANTTPGTLAFVVDADATEINADGGNSFACRWGDVNGDSLVDLYVANRTGANGQADLFDGQNFLYLNNGEGDGVTTFTRVTIGPAVEEECDSTGVDFVDVQGDGDPWIVVSNTFSDSNDLYDNRGGQFADFGSSLPFSGSVEPRMAFDGPLTDNSSLEIAISSGPPNANTALFGGVSTVNVGFKGGVLVPNVSPAQQGFTFVFPVPLDGSGNLLVPALLIPPGIPAGVDLFLHTWMTPAAGNPENFAATNAVRMTFQGP